MSSSYQYSCCYEIECSHVDILVIYELEYSPCIMIISHLTRCFIVHIMFMNRFRLMLWWWFIMLSGTSKPFPCRSVGSGTRGVWVVPMNAAEVPGYIGVGECISCPTVEG
jgi:hypothetical protein